MGLSPISWWLWARHPNVPSNGKTDTTFPSSLVSGSRAIKSRRKTCRRELLRFQRVWSLSLFWGQENNSVCASVLTNSSASLFPFTSVSLSLVLKGRSRGRHSHAPRNSQSHRWGKTPHSEPLYMGRFVISKALSGLWPQLSKPHCHLRGHLLPLR